MAARTPSALPTSLGHMVWGRSRVDYELVDATNTGLGHRRTRHRANPDRWVISVPRPHPALVSEADFITVQTMRATRADARHEYRLKGLLRCTLCERRFEGHWVNDVPGYRCRHGHTSAKDPDAPRPRLNLDPLAPVGFESHPAGHGTYPTSRWIQRLLRTRKPLTIDFVISSL